MSKLPQEYKFVDLSDYGRRPARWIATSLGGTRVTPIHVTTWFVIAGLLVVPCVIHGYYLTAGLLLILKSILDAADGELSRVNNSPSYVGRYYDSIADILLNFIFLLTIAFVTATPLYLALLAFIGIQLQGTLYNYYYVILRNSVDGDTTSRIFEDVAPTAMEGESQRAVDITYAIYDFLYILFDKTIYHLDSAAMESRPFPRWFMSLLSTFGLGFQLLVMAVLLALHLQDWIIPFFICYSLLIFVFVGVRRLIL